MIENDPRQMTPLSSQPNQGSEDAGVLPVVPADVQHQVAGLHPVQEKLQLPRIVVGRNVRGVQI